jgi:hypothetical protein
MPVLRRPIEPAALFGHAKTAWRCPLTRQKQKSRRKAATSDFDRTGHSSPFQGSRCNCGLRDDWAPGSARGLCLGLQWDIN